MKFTLTPKRFFYVLVSLIAILIIGSGVGLYFANSFLQKRSNDVVALKITSHQLDEQISAFRSAKSDLKKYEDLQSLVDRVVPSEKDQARIVRELEVLASANGIKVASINFPTSTLGQKATGSAGAAAGSGATTGTGTNTPTPALPSITQAKPVDGLSGVYAIQTNFIPLVDKNNVVTYAQLISFLDKLELNRRTIQVTNIQVTPQGITTSSGINFTLTMNLFVKPDIATPTTNTSTTK